MLRWRALCDEQRIFTCVGHLQVLVRATAGVSEHWVGSADGTAVLPITALRNCSVADAAWTEHVLNLIGRPSVGAGGPVTASIVGTVDKYHLPLSTKQMCQRALTCNDADCWEAGVVGLQVFEGASAGIRSANNIGVELAHLLAIASPPEDIHSAPLRAPCIGNLDWRPSLAAGLSVCTSIQSWLHMDHSMITAQVLDIAAGITGDSFLCGNNWCCEQTSCCKQQCGAESEAEHGFRRRSSLNSERWDW